MHPNLNGWLVGLTHRGHTSLVLVDRVGQGERSDLGSRILMPHAGRKRLATLLSIPASARVLLKHMGESDIVILRMEPTLSFAMGTLLSVFCRSRVSLYSQDPAGLPPRRVWRRVCGRLARHALRVAWFSPTADAGRASGPACLSDGLVWPSYVPFGAHGEAPDPRPHLGSREDRPVRFLSVGKMMARKGLLELVRVFAHLPEAVRQRVILEIAGEASTIEQQSYLVQLQTLASTVGASVTVNIYPNLSRSALWRRMCESHVFILNSHREPASVSQLEAMAAGMALLVKADNGTSHVVEGGVNGFVFSEGDELGRRIIELVNDQALLLRLQAGSLSLARTIYAPDIVAGQLLENVGRVEGCR